MVGAPVIFRLHTLSAFVLFALWPFSSLVHVFSIPLDNLTTALVALSLLSGFLAHFAGGYVAGRKAREHGGLQGVMVAILGFLFVVAAALIISAIVVATAGLFLVEGGVALPALTLGFAGGALLASLALLALNLLGGFFDGKLGEWETGPVNTSGGPDSLRGRTR